MDYKIAKGIGRLTTNLDLKLLLKRDNSEWT